MNSFFDQNGHLTQLAIAELIYGSPSELSRLEAAEHLSFCDSCLLEYTKAQESAHPDFAPEPPKNLMHKVLFKNAKISVKRYISLGVAASITIALWNAGTFSRDFYPTEYLRTRAEAVAQKYIEIKTTAEKALDEQKQEFLADLQNFKEVFNDAK